MDIKGGGASYPGPSSQSSYQNGASPSPGSASGTMLKRKCSSLDSSVDEDDDGMEVDDVKRFARQNHSSKTAYTEASHKPSFLSDDDLKHIILEAADGFLFVVGCDRARILFVSESVKKILHYSRNDLIGQSLFDYIHPRDINKVKEQFSSSDLAPRERLIDAKTLMPVKTELPQRPTHLCSGARRSFYCRMKYRNEGCDTAKGVKLEKEENEYSHRKRKSDQKSYTVIHFTGYLKSWPTSKINISSEDDLDDSSNFLSCLVAVGRIRTSMNHNSSTCVSTPCMSNSLSQTPQLRPVEYMFRITLDGKLSFIDQETTLVLGYLPQELLGTSVYEYYHQDDITRMAEIHRKVLDSRDKIQTGVYRFKGKNGSFLHVRSNCFSFRNPWTKEVEYIVSTNSVVPTEEVTSSGQTFEGGVLSMDTDCSGNDDISVSGMSQEKLFVPGLPGGTKPGAGRIGRQIADEMLENSRNSRSPQVVDSTNTEVLDSQQQIKSKRLPFLPSIPSQSSSGITSSMSSSTMAVPHGPNGLSSPALGLDAAHLQESSSLLDTVIEEQAIEGMANIGGGTDDGDEAAMSMIMSLLEADAGLGGPIDFNDLPWPL
nr:brain and muscle ARNT-like protein [Sinonovacula constricta]